MNNWYIYLYIAHEVENVNSDPLYLGIIWIFFQNLRLTVRVLYSVVGEGAAAKERFCSNHPPLTVNTQSERGCCNEYLLTGQYACGLRQRISGQRRIRTTGQQAAGLGKIKIQVIVCCGGSRQHYLYIICACIHLARAAVY